MSFHVPHQYRVRKGLLGTTDKHGNNGAFLVPTGDKFDLQVIASDGLGWEHVSVSLPGRTPTWEEMCSIKSLFWDDEDAVMQLHPPQSSWVNNHAYCLHLWRPVGQDIPLPPDLMVGIKGKTPDDIKGMLK